MTETPPQRSPAPLLPRMLTVTTAVALGATLVMVLIIVGRPLATDDLWFHLKMGQTYLEQGLWPAMDPMLHTGGPPVQHEWLFGVFVHLWRQAFGLSGLRVVHLLLVGGIVALAFAALRRRSPNLQVALAALAGFVAISWPRLVQLRPHLVSMAAVVALYLLVLEPKQGPSRRRMALAVLLCVVWANVHSLFLIGPALLSAATLGALFHLALLRRVQPAAPTKPARRRTVRLGVCALLCLLASAINPRGFAQHLTFFSASSGRTAVWEIDDEWTPFFPFFPSAPYNSDSLPLLTWMVTDLLLVLLVAAAVLVRVRWRRDPSARTVEAIDPARFFTAFASVGAMLISFRFLWMGILVLTYLAGVVRHRPAGQRPPRAVVPWALAGVTLAIALALPGWGGWSREAAALPPDPAEYLTREADRARYADVAVRFLAQSGLRGRMFNHYFMGGYLGYHLAPRLRTFIDGRTEHYGKDVFDDYRAIIGRKTTAHGTYLQLLDRRQVDVFVALGGPRYGRWVTDTLDHLEGAPGWLPVFRSWGMAVFVRDLPRNAANLDRVAAHYRDLKVPFDRHRGFDTHRVIRQSPRWATAHKLLPPDYPAMLARSRSPDADQRFDGLVALAGLYAAISDHLGAAQSSAAALTIRLRAQKPRLLLVRSLLRLGRLDQAARQADLLTRHHPGQKRFVDLKNWIEGLRRKRQ